MVAKPQPFLGVWKGLDIGVKTVDKVLRRLREGWYVVQDGAYLYWVEELE